MVVNGLDMTVVVCHIEDMDEPVSTGTAHELQSCTYRDTGHNTTSSLEVVVTVVFWGVLNTQDLSNVSLYFKYYVHELHVIDPVQHTRTHSTNTP